MTKTKTLEIDGVRVKACIGSDSLRGLPGFPSKDEITCPECPRFYLAAACQTHHGTSVIPRHRAQEA